MHFLAPHNDDEALFGSYTLLRHKPTVHVMLRCNKHYDWQERTAESIAACKILGVEFVQAPFLETDPDWDLIAGWIEELDGHVWAPLPEHGGHPQHNPIGEIAATVLSPERVTFYATYTHKGGKTTKGTPVEFEEDWPAKKLLALGCYTTQRLGAATQAAFQWPLAEYELRASDDAVAER